MSFGLPKNVALGNCAELMNAPKALFRADEKGHRIEKVKGFWSRVAFWYQDWKSGGELTKKANEVMLESFKVLEPDKNLYISPTENKSVNYPMLLRAFNASQFRHDDEIKSVIARLKE